MTQMAITASNSHSTYDKLSRLAGHCMPCQQADGHHHLDYVQNIYVICLYVRFNGVTIFSCLMVYMIQNN